MRVFALYNFDSVKYLILILDRKLSWKSYIGESMKKASFPLYFCREILVREISWLYETIAKIIIFYGVLVSWNSMEIATLVRQLESVQQAASISIHGAMRPTATSGT